MELAADSTKGLAFGVCGFWVEQTLDVVFADAGIRHEMAQLGVQLAVDVALMAVYARLLHSESATAASYLGSGLFWLAQPGLVRKLSNIFGSKITWEEPSQQSPTSFPENARSPRPTGSRGVSSAPSSEQSEEESSPSSGSRSFPF